MVHDSLGHNRREVASLSNALPHFLEPRPGISAVNHAADKAQPLGCIVTVPPNVILRDPGVHRKKTIHAPGLGEDVRRVAKLWSLHDDGSLNIENVFLPEQIDPARPT